MTKRLAIIPFLMASSFSYSETTTTISRTNLITQPPTHYEFRAYSIAQRTYGSDVNIQSVKIDRIDGLPIKKTDGNAYWFVNGASKIDDFWESKTVYIPGCYNQNAGWWNYRDNPKSHDHFGNVAVLNSPESQYPKDIVYCDNNVVALIENGELLDTLKLGQPEIEAAPEKENSPAFAATSVQFPNVVYLARANRAYAIEVKDNKLSLSNNGLIYQRAKNEDNVEKVMNRLNVSDHNQIVNRKLYEDYRYPYHKDNSNQQTGLSVFFENDKPWLLFSQQDRFPAQFEGQAKPAILLKMPLDPVTGLFPESPTVTPLASAFKTLDRMSLHKDVETKEDGCYHRRCYLYDYSIAASIAGWTGINPRIVLTGHSALEGNVSGLTSNSLPYFENKLNGSTNHIQDDYVVARTHGNGLVVLNRPTASDNDFQPTGPAVSVIKGYKPSEMSDFEFTSVTDTEAMHQLSADLRNAFDYQKSLVHRNQPRIMKRDGEKESISMSNDLKLMTHQGKVLHFEGGLARAGTLFKRSTNSEDKDPHGYEIYTSELDGSKPELLLRAPLPAHKTTKNYYDDIAMFPVWK